MSWADRSPRPIWESQEWTDPKWKKTTDYKTDPTTDQDSDPTPQPATRGQDSQDCAFVRLPEKITLAESDVGNFFRREGVWENDDGATYLSWYQDRFSWSYNTVQFWDGDFMLASVVSTAETALEEAGILLPASRRSGNSHLAVKDCRGVIMYVFLENMADPTKYEVYNRKGQLLSTSFKGQIYPDQLEWRDYAQVPMALAQSPVVSTAPNMHKHYEAQRESHVVKMWQIEYQPSFNSNSSLLKSQFRWVLAMATQMMAIRELDMVPQGHGRLRTPAIFPLFVLFQIFVASGVIALLLLCFRRAYDVVYQPAPTPAILNPYLKDWAPYGALVQQHKWP